MPCIYVVDDNLDLVWALKKALNLRGYTVVSAGNGLEALQQMRRQTPDLLITDMQMPVMGGVDLARRMRADPLLNDIPILFLTVHSDFPSKAECFRAGADDFMIKPFELKELAARVEAILRRCSPVPDAERNHVRASGATLELSTGTFQANGRRVQLTDVESDLLRYLMARADTPISAQTLMEEVLDYPTGSGDPSAVRWHIKNLRQKIEPDPDHPRSISTVPSRGYTFLTH
jgi:two-component system response regulator RpaA